MSEPLRVAVIGAGPGGYAAAFRAADLGMEVTLIDRESNPGGVCLYRGCIPSKALLHVAGVLREAKSAAEMGIHFPAPRIDLQGIREWNYRTVKQLTEGLGTLRRQKGITYLQGNARFLDSSTLAVTQGVSDDIRVECDYTIIATGSRPATVPILLTNSSRVMDSNKALQLEDVPETLLVVGGGYIGLELGLVYSALGAAVTVVEIGPTLLPGVDPELVNVLRERLEGNFEQIVLDTKVVGLFTRQDGVDVELLLSSGESRISRHKKVLVSVGREPNSGDLGLETTVAETSADGWIVTDSQGRTAQSNVFAIGDVAGAPMLAHKAAHEARVAVDAIGGKPTIFDPSAIPAVVFTDPEIAWCGLTEVDAKARRIHVDVARYPWVASGRAATLGRRDGMTKLIVQSRTDRVLGVGIVGPGAGELIAEGVLAVEMGAQVRDLGLTIHPHPTLSETLMESASVFYGESPHYGGSKAH